LSLPPLTKSVNEGPAFNLSVKVVVLLRAGGLEAGELAVNAAGSAVAVAY